MALLSFTTPATVMAQAPVEDLTSREQAIQRGQQKTGAAHRDLEQARYEAKLAEQDLLNAQDAHRAAQKQADALKRELDAAKKALDAARAREAQARKRYDAALSETDRAFKQAPKKP